MREEQRPTFMKDLPEHLLCIRAEWEDLLERYRGELGVRDLILKSMCPEVHGMYAVKLAVALAVCSNVNQVSAAANDSTDVRGSSHLLLVGDPGLAKSRLLKYASKIAIRSVHTTGTGCSAAGLTAAVVKEDGEWQLEAGALVMADGGICCLDEFNLMRETEKTSILEAMEQQTVSLAKAGLVCKLSTRCSVLAATNPKKVGSKSSATNIGIASPLLSRFDVVLMLRDERNPEWDSEIADHVLKRTKNIAEQFSDDLWTIDKMQSHFLAIRDIQARMTREANAILAAYYHYCRADPFRDVARTTVRLFDSLVRLAQAHARLVFRSEVTIIDAIAVIQLMESSWGFGRLVTPLNIIKQALPLGPTDNDVKDILTKLKLSKLLEMESPKANDKVQLTRLRNKENINDVNTATVVRTGSKLDTLDSSSFRCDAQNLDDLDPDTPSKRIGIKRKSCDVVVINNLTQTSANCNVDTDTQSSDTNQRTNQLIFKKKKEYKCTKRNINTQSTVSNDSNPSQVSSDRNSEQSIASKFSQGSQSTSDSITSESEPDSEPHESIDLQAPQRKGFFFDSSDDDIDDNTSIGSFIVTQSSSGASTRSSQSKTAINSQVLTDITVVRESASAEYSQRQYSTKPQRKSKFVLDTDSDEDLNINAIVREASSISKGTTSTQSQGSHDSNVLSNQRQNIKNRLQKKPRLFYSDTEDGQGEKNECLNPANLQEANKSSNSKQTDEETQADNDSAYDTLVNTSEPSASGRQFRGFTTEGVDLSCLDFD